MQPNLQASLQKCFNPTVTGLRLPTVNDLHPKKPSINWRWNFHCVLWDAAHSTNLHMNEDLQRRVCEWPLSQTPIPFRWRSGNNDQQQRCMCDCFVLQDEYSSFVMMRRHSARSNLADNTHSSIDSLIFSNMVHLFLILLLCQRINVIKCYHQICFLRMWIPCYLSSYSYTAGIDSKLNNTCRAKRILRFCLTNYGSIHSLWLQVAQLLREAKINS